MKILIGSDGSAAAIRLKTNFPKWDISTEGTSGSPVGSVASAIASRAHCSVEVVREPEEGSAENLMTRLS